MLCGEVLFFIKKREYILIIRVIYLYLSYK
jgi:hypothetical protein